MKNFSKLSLLLITPWLLTSCGEPPGEDASFALPKQNTGITEAGLEPSIHQDRNLTYTEQREPCASYDPLRKPLFGDLHVHTALSFDAVAGRINTMPEDAHKFAMGEAIPFFPLDEAGKPAGTLKIDRPLDFLAVTDHAEFLGEKELCSNSSSPEYALEFCTDYREIEFRGTLMLATMLAQRDPQRIEMLCGEEGGLCRQYAKEPWQRIIQAADAAYDRSATCKFTSFIAYEYTGTPDQSNYHRNVIFRNSNVPTLPVSYVEAPFDYLLWDQLNGLCSEENGCDYVTIPHNSNMSNGKLLSPYANIEQTPANKLDYAKARLKREPLMEIFQHKGGSECVNGLQSVLGDVDELCDIEQVRVFGEKDMIRDFHLEGTELVLEPEEEALSTECGDGSGKLGMFAGGCISRNDFLRSALLTGIEEAQKIGSNPVKLGVIASTDGHTGTPGDVVEDQWRGSVSGEMTVKGRLTPGKLPSGIKGNPGGLAGVWAVENSRDAIFEAFERREVFGTSGPRIVPRFFGGWDYAANSCEQPSELVGEGYARGVPMGGDLPTRSGRSAPVFIAAAMSDAVESATPLQMLQLIKGWIDKKGEAHYKVYTVAGSPNKAAGVDTSTARSFGEGHQNLCTVFTDPDFDASVPAYYYMRVVENPSARWSLYDCLSLPAAERPEVCSQPKNQVIQEMAWTSPIWYTPSSAVMEGQ